METKDQKGSGTDTTNRMKFDELSKLTPAQLEALRQREVEACISKAPDHLQRRLRGLQFEIDAKRKAHKSALGSCIAISKMMQESLERLNAALNGEAPPPQRQPAEVISFQQARQKRQDRPSV
jgi:hypothetical protein